MKPRKMIKTALRNALQNCYKTANCAEHCNWSAGCVRCKNACAVKTNGQHFGAYRECKRVCKSSGQCPKRNPFKKNRKCRKCKKGCKKTVLKPCHKACGQFCWRRQPSYNVEQCKVCTTEHCAGVDIEDVMEEIS